MASAIEQLDAFLSDVRHLSLIDADRVRDMLLDLRTAIEDDLFDEAAMAHG